MRRLLTTGPVALCLAGVLLVLGGCGGDWDDDYDYDGRCRYDKTLFVYLNVADQDGNAMPGVTVWVDGTQQGEKTSDEYRELGSQFPPEWRGWQYNWSGGPYWIDIRDCTRRSCTIEILVSRTGYVTQRGTITLDCYDPDEVYMRQTFVMEPRSDSNTAAIMDAPQPAEKTGLVDNDA
ncbi:MAG: hypothetical protein U9R79_06035 [Armatimonadota bacterium]|nr:hypothetical protein [Armatimonadota bacterium]